MDQAGRSLDALAVRAGDFVVAVVPGSTVNNVVFLADDGMAYTKRMYELQSSGSDDPITKFFCVGDDVKIIGAVTTDERFMPADKSLANDESVGGRDLLLAKANGQVLRTPLAPFCTPSTSKGRRYIRVHERNGDRVVMAALLKEEKSIFLATRSGHVIHFPINQVTIGRTVIGIKLASDDMCIGGALIAKSSDLLQVVTTNGKTMDFTGRHETTARGGMGWQAVKRTGFARAVPPAIQLVDWDEIEAKRKEPSGIEEQTRVPLSTECTLDVNIHVT